MDDIHPAHHIPLSIMIFLISFTTVLHFPDPIPPNWKVLHFDTNFGQLETEKVARV